MTYWDAFVYGALQGITEFLPISSSAHLAVLPQTLKIVDPGVSFDLMVHIGTALAVFVIYRKEFVTLFFSCFKILSPSNNPNILYARHFCLATLCTIFAVFTLKPLAFEYGRMVELIAINLVVFGFLMFVADLFKEKKSKDHLHQTWDWKLAVGVGLTQALAIFPGVSRSGITMTTSRALGLGRERAADFSFMLSLPLIIGGGLYQLPEYSQSQNVLPLGICLFSIFVSFLVGGTTILFFLKLIKKIGLGYFALYRLLLAWYIVT